MSQIQNEPTLKQYLSGLSRAALVQRIRRTLTENGFIFVKLRSSDAYHVSSRPHLYHVSERVAAKDLVRFAALLETEYANMRATKYNAAAEWARKHKKEFHPCNLDYGSEMQGLFAFLKSNLRHTQSLMMGGATGGFDVDAERDETAEVWRITVTPKGNTKPTMSGYFPANFHNDKRTAQEFMRDLMVAWYPASLVADMARKDSSAAKRNRRKVM